MEYNYACLIASYSHYNGLEHSEPHKIVAFIDMTWLGFQGLWGLLTCRITVKVQVG